MNVFKIICFGLVRSQVLSPSSFCAVDQSIHSIEQDPDADDDLGFGNDEFRSAAEEFIGNKRFSVSIKSKLTCTL